MCKRKELKFEQRSFFSFLTKPVLLTIFLIVSGIARVYSQSSDGQLSLRQLYPGGSIPTVPSNVLTHSYVGTAVDTVHNLIYVKLDYKLWTYSITKNLWLKQDSLPIDYNLNDMAYDPGQHRLLFWDRGVGRVFARSDSGRYRRLDHSFNQRNQFGHLGWFDPNTHRIYAFGGYGLFTAKNIVTYYDPSAREWFLVDVTNPKSAPAKQTAAMGVFDSQNNELYMIGTAPDKREALWKLSLTSKSWSVVGYLNPGIQKYTSKNFTFDYWFDSYIGSANLALFAAVDLEHQHEIRLLAFDTQTDKLAFLPLQSQALPSGTDCANIIWLRKKHRLLLVLWKYMPTQTNYQAAIYEIPIGSPGKLKRYVNSHNDHVLYPPPRLTRPESNHLFYLMIGCFLGIGIVLIFRFTRERKKPRVVVTNNNVAEKPVPLPKKMSSDTEVSEIPNSSNDKLTIILSSPLQFYYKGTYSASDLPVYENRLLYLLANRLISTNQYVLTDEIDSTLWHNHTSPDYVRKARNKTIERLETTLQRIAPLEDNQVYILRRNYVYDNRKAEFGLNPDACRILPDDDVDE